MFKLIRDGVVGMCFVTGVWWWTCELLPVLIEWTSWLLSAMNEVNSA